MSLHLSILPNRPIFSSFETVSPATGRRHSNLTQPTSISTQPPRATSQNHIIDDDSDMIAAYAHRVKRNDSMFSQPGNSGSQGDAPIPSISSTATVHTHSIPGAFGAGGVVFERRHSAPCDDDLIMVTVRLSNNFRRASVNGAEDLPTR